MLLVFEGPDGAGKTTLFRSVATNMRLRSVVNNRPLIEYQNMPRPDVVIGWPDAQVVHAEYNALRQMDLLTADLLKDRFWVTDIVYSQVFLRDPYGRSYVQPWRDFGPSVGVVHVNVRDWKVLAERRQVSPSDHMYDFLPRLSDGMKEYFARTTRESSRWCPVLTVFTDGVAGLDDLTRAVISFTEELQ